MTCPHKVNYCGYYERNQNHAVRLLYTVNLHQTICPQPSRLDSRKVKMTSGPKVRYRLSATVSGSFHRHMDAITAVVHELASLSVRVLSPADPRVVAAQGEFLFVASDRVRSVRLVQDRHLESIRAADFLWLVCPDGYVGQSASMEVGFAAAAGVPIFATQAPSDLTLSEYVTVVRRLTDAIHKAASSAERTRQEGLLVDPRASVEEAHDILERIKASLTTQSSPGDNLAIGIHSEVVDLHSKIALPTCLQ